MLTGRFASTGLFKKKESSLANWQLFSLPNTLNFGIGFRSGTHNGELASMIS